MQTCFFLSSLLLLFSVGHSSSVSLTSSSFHDETEGKTVFIKFFAPWCGHCKTLAPGWESLASAFAKRDDLLIGSVDCDDSESKSLCDDNGVESFPTLLYGEPFALRVYEGERTLEAMTDFVEGGLFDDSFLASFEHGIPGKLLNLFFVPQDEDGNDLEGVLLLEEWKEGEQYELNTYNDHVFEVRDSSGTVLSRWVMDQESPERLVESVHDEF